MHPTLQALKNKVTLPDGSRKRGAVSRLAEKLDVCRSTVVRWLNGEWIPGDAQLRQIERGILPERVKLDAKKTGPRNGR